MKYKPKLCLIVARGRNGVIGREGALPWRLRDDLSLFKETTKGAPLMMGRKTWESLPRKPLPGRENIVLSRNPTFQAEGARVYSGVSAALAVAQTIALRAGVSEVFVSGGAGLYKETLPMADRIYLTDVDASPEGDVMFPTFEEAQWSETERRSFEKSEGNEHAFDFRRLDRI